MTDVIRAPLCPGCDRPPPIAMSGQFFCGNDDCLVIVWNPYDDPARFKATAYQVDLSTLFGGQAQ